MPVCCEGLVDYYDDPRKVSAVDKNAKDVGTGSITQQSIIVIDNLDNITIAIIFSNAPGCGDVMKLYLHMDEHDTIVDSLSTTIGCGAVGRLCSPR
ncbi:hypothetical protein PHYSODRAFT_503615 [Phytophthora sojae]|uniref:NIF system FeS cluster assembly NifU N-terminal domain-containing protein n=1 Tax=Phytophthora sojae (strain P6497) TaxID=1094619 RepID=G4ZJK6_PHYSP|nr:hypothetical protein PHYSODRAFT_503615 [Phytophthora sojae]EGZ18871.1 hypothetical protein PHYSODRAFT_503615 [Phytophthora sojae]|eukprot:XP_009527929.1 hypothetical protein PHYSODRAFT_503615 [Phytophthora sojae]